MVLHLFPASFWHPHLADSAFFITKLNPSLNMANLAFSLERLSRTLPCVDAGCLEISFFVNQMCRAYTVALAGSETARELFLVSFCCKVQGYWRDWSSCDSKQTLPSTRAQTYIHIYKCVCMLQKAEKGKIKHLKVSSACHLLLKSS